MTDEPRDPQAGPVWADTDVHPDADAVWADASTDLELGLEPGPDEHLGDPLGAQAASRRQASSGAAEPTLAFGGGSGSGSGDELGSGGGDDALPRRPRRKLVSPTTAGLAAIVLVACGFAGGVVVQKGRASGATTAGAPTGQGMRAMGGAPGGAGGAGGAAGGQTPSGAGQAASGAATGGGTGTGTTATAGTASTTSGEVSNVKGGTIYITKSDGTTVRVVASDGATIQRTAKASMSGVHPGDTVVVSGTADDDGTVAATSVTATAEGVTSAGGIGGMNGGPPGETGR